MYWLPRARITSASCPRRLARTVETPGGLPDAAHMHREAPSALSVTFFGGRAQQGPFSASGAIECRLREALRVKTWCRRSRRRHSHLPRGRGNYGCHRSRPRCHSGCAGFQSRSKGVIFSLRVTFWKMCDRPTQALYCVVTGLSLWRSVVVGHLGGIQALE